MGRGFRGLEVSFSLGRVGFFGHRCRNIFLPLPSVPACPGLLPRNFCLPPRFLCTSRTAFIFSVSTRTHFSSSISCHHAPASSTPALGQAIQYLSVSRSPGRSRFFTTSTSILPSCTATSSSRLSALSSSLLIYPYFQISDGHFDEALY